MKLAVLLILISTLAQAQFIDYNTQIKNKPNEVFLDTAKYNFPTVSVTSSLIIGNSSVTFSLPLGVNGTDAHHYLYVVGGGGASEACLITGGSGVAGRTGTIIINCANAHTGSFTISSATAGIQEAIIAGGTTGTPVKLACGTLLINSQIYLSSQIEMYGCGMGAGPGVWADLSVTKLNVNFATGDVILAVSYYSFNFHDFQMNYTGSTRTSGASIHIQAPNPGTSTNTASTVERVAFVKQNIDIQLDLCLMTKIMHTYHVLVNDRAIYAPANLNAAIESSFGEIAFNYLSNNTIPATNTALDIRVGYGTIHDNLIVGFLYGILVVNDAHASGSLQIYHNHMENASGNEVSIVNGSGIVAQDIQVVNNEFQALGGDSGPYIHGFIFIGANSGGVGSWVNNIVIQGNVMRGQMTWAGGPAYISVQTGTGVLIKDNVIWHSGGDTAVSYATGTETVNAQIIAGPETGTSTVAKYSIGTAAQTKIIDYQGLPFASLFAVANGSQLYVTDSNDCVSGSGSGRICYRKGGNWVSSLANGDSATLSTLALTGVLTFSEGSPIASAGTIAPTTSIFHITGVTTINTITLPAGYTAGPLCAIPDGLWSTGTAGNIATATVAAVGQPVCWEYSSSTSKWYPSYIFGQNQALLSTSTPAFSTVNATTRFIINGVNGVSKTYTVRNSLGTGTCTIIMVGGIDTGTGTC